MATAALLHLTQLSPTQKTAEDGLDLSTSTLSFEGMAVGQKYQLPQSPIWKKEEHE